MTGPDAASADTNPDAGSGSGLDDMPRYHAQDSFDAQTNAPSRNFRFDFSEMHFFVREEWQEVLGDFFLLPANYAHVKSPLVKEFGALLRKMWSPHNFKGQVSPHELLQARVRQLADDETQQVRVQCE